MNYVLPGSSRVIVNGLAGKPIKLKRGVRQGDPLSPYIFILAFDFLSQWLSKLVSFNHLSVFKLGLHPAFFYADDTIIFFQPHDSQAFILKIIFTFFGSFSGLSLNSSKSDLATLFVDDSDKQRLANILGCSIKEFPLTYLGLPLTYKKLPKASYNKLLLRFNSKLQGWSSALLSKAGRLILLNACLSSLPVYFMSVFSLPKWVLKAIDKIRRNFLWHGISDGSKKLIMVPWNSITLPKEVGGLGILDLQSFNLALLSKWLWKWTQPDFSLWKHTIHTLYPAELTFFPQNSCLAKPFSQCVFIFNTGLFFHPTTGNNILFWKHNWGHGVLQFTMPELFSFTTCPDISLRNFVLAANHVSSLFQPLITTSSKASSQLNLLLCTIRDDLHLQVNNFTEEDLPLWKFGSANNFSVSSFYSVIKTVPKHSSRLFPIWSLNVPPRFRFFLWQLLSNKLPTLDNLKLRGWCLPNRCVMCRSDEESVDHLFQNCTFFIQWFNGLCIHLNFPCSFTLLNPSEMILSNLVSTKFRDISAISYFIFWRERCARIFKGTDKHGSLLLSEVLLEFRSRN